MERINAKRGRTCRSSVIVAVRAAELPVEQGVSCVIGNMHFVCLPVGDDPDPQSARGAIGRGAIPLFSEYGK